METIPVNTWRIIDANLNRIGEGLRVLEELARLLLNDVILTQQLKNMRHELVQVDASLQPQLLQARDSESDVGTNLEVPGEKNDREVSAILVANARRVQESLRVMEEIAKTRGTGLDPEKFKQSRFTLYTVEKALFSRWLRRDKVQRLRGLYVIIDSAALRGRNHLEVTAQVIRGGAKIIQLRDKMLSKKELLPLAREIKDLCAGEGALFIMNDYLDIALAVNADGLHVGQDDLPVKIARRLLPIDKILGCSARTLDEAAAAHSEGADYIAIGAIYPTSSKDATEVVGIARLKQVRQALNVPLVAIGGINKDSVGEVLAAGADALAVISAVLGGEAITEATRMIIERLENERSGESGTDCRADTSDSFG